MLEPAGDLGLDEEPLAAGRVVGVMVEDLLECDFSVQLDVQRHEDRPQPSSGVRPQDPEPLAPRGCRPDGVAACVIDVAIRG